MTSLTTEFWHRQPITHEMIKTMRTIGEYKGKEELYREQFPQVLDSLRNVAVIQSTESSNRLEGLSAPFPRIRDLVMEKTTPQNRTEQEIAGYRDVLNLIHSHAQEMRLSPNLLLQFHRDLFRYTSVEGGRWKMSDNRIIQHAPDGSTFTRFHPTSAFAVPEAMRKLQEDFSSIQQQQEIDDLFLAAAFILDFLCIHPFTDGNGRLSRLLTTLLLYQAEFSVARYISLEKIIEDSKEGYYESLYASSQNWHEGEHTIIPWLNYFLGIVLAAYKDFSSRVGELTVAKGAKTHMVLNAIERMPTTFRMVDIERQCPNVTRDMIRVVINRLKKEGSLICEGAGPGAIWRKRES